MPIEELRARRNYHRVVDDLLITDRPLARIAGRHGMTWAEVREIHDYLVAIGKPVPARAASPGGARRLAREREEDRLVPLVGRELATTRRPIDEIARRLHTTRSFVLKVRRGLIAEGISIPRRRAPARPKKAQPEPPVVEPAPAPVASVRPRKGMDGAVLGRIVADIVGTEHTLAEIARDHRASYPAVQAIYRELIRSGHAVAVRTGAARPRPDRARLLLLTTDEPIATVAQRANMTREAAQQLYREMVDGGEKVFMRRPGTPEDRIRIGHDILAGPEPFADIARRHGVPVAKVHVIKRKLAAAGWQVPERPPTMPGNPMRDAVVAAILATDESLSGLARRLGVNANLVFRHYHRMIAEGLPVPRRHKPGSGAG